MSKDRDPARSFTKEDFRIDWFNPSGGGGQHKNKHANGCRIKHLESGLMSVGKDHKERKSNQKDAFNRLAAKLIEYYQLDKPSFQAEKSDEVIRVYHEPRNMVKDYASGETDTYKNVVLDGNLGDMLEARRKTKE